MRAASARPISLLILRAPEIRAFADTPNERPRRLKGRSKKPLVCDQSRLYGLAVT
jgi:hypothetical protein